MAGLATVRASHLPMGRSRLYSPVSPSAIDGGQSRSPTLPQLVLWPPEKTVSADLCPSLLSPHRIATSQGDSPPSKDSDLPPWSVLCCTTIHGDGKWGSAIHDVNPQPEQHAKCGVPPLSNEQDGKPFNESSNKPNPEPCSGKGAEDHSAERQTAEKRPPDAGMPLASSPGSAVTAKAQVPPLSNESGGKHAGGPPRTPDLEHGSRVRVMDTSAARQHVGKQSRDASIGSQHTLQALLTKSNSQRE